MKRKIITSLLLLPLLASCGGNGGELVIKVVDEDYVPTLPTYKDKTAGTLLEDEDYAYFDFYELSDFHGAVTYSKDDNRLGIQKLSSYFDAARTGNPKGTFLLSGGDMWQGSADSNVTRGNLVTYSMNVMNFDTMTLGNHEFDWTTKWIENNKAKANFPFLAANLVEKGTGNVASFVKPSTVITRGDYKVGVIGTIGDNIKDSIIASAVADYEFKDEVETVISESKKLREEQDCDIVVWSSHNDIEYLKKSTGSKDLGVDLVFGGHSHTTTVSDINGIPALESKDYARSIAHCQLKLKKDTGVVSAVEGYSCDENPTAVDYADDADIKGIFDQYNETYIKPVKEQKLGKASDTFGTNVLANYAVEEMFKRIKADYPDAEIRAAFTNVNGGVRAPISKGDIAYGNVYESFPFDNELVIMETTGRKLQNYVGGMVSNAAFYQNIYKYGELNSTDKYLFVTTDYLATSTSFFAGNDVKVYTKLVLRDIIAEAIKKAGTINPKDFLTTAKPEFDKIK